MRPKSLKNLVSVYGMGVGEPLLQTDGARLIQIRDSNGDVMALFFKLNSELWGFTTKGDPDWSDHLRNLEIRESADDSED